MVNYLVTGGAGFIGSHLVRTLIARNKSVRILDNFITGKRQNLDELIPSVELVEGDIRSLDKCRKAVRGIDCVLHQAALPSVQRSIQDPAMTNAINITGTLNMLVAAQAAGVRRFVFASSSSVYGNDKGLPKKEGNEGTPLSPYAVSKQAGEHYCRLFSLINGMETICLRYFNVFGPRQDPSSQYSAAIPLFITRIMNGESPIVYGDGEQSRDFTYVDNIVAANILASEAQKVSGETVNIACGERLSINSLLGLINSALGTDVPPVYAASKPGEILHSIADISKARKILGYAPMVSHREGLERTIAWYKRTA